MSLVVVADRLVVSALKLFGAGQLKRLINHGVRQSEGSGRVCNAEIEGRIV